MAQWYNSNCSTLGVGCYLYEGPGLTNPVANGWYSDGVNCYTVTGGGIIYQMAPCPAGFVTIDYYVPYSMTCYSNYTFTAYASTLVNTNVNVEITWYGDLGGIVTGTVTISAYNTCSTANVYSGGLNCFGENISTTSVNLDPSSYGGQVYQVGTQYPIGLSPC